MCMFWETDLNIGCIFPKSKIQLLPDKNMRITETIFILSRFHKHKIKNYQSTDSYSLKSSGLIEIMLWKILQRSCYKRCHRFAL